MCSTILFENVRSMNVHAAKLAKVHRHVTMPAIINGNPIFRDIRMLNRRLETTMVGRINPMSNILLRENPVISTGLTGGIFCLILLNQRESPFNCKTFKRNTISLIKLAVPFDPMKSE